MKRNILNFTLPKNIKQIGSVDEDFKIYMEDFVFSFLNQYSKDEKGEEVVAILVGESYSIDGNKVLFINGAIKGEHTILENGMLKLTDKSFEVIEKEMETYFNGKEIVGWFYSQPGFSDYINDEYIKYHKKTFKKPYQVFFLNDPIENICLFYKYSKNTFENIKGFIVYYEKNEAMNEYILANKSTEIDPDKEKFKEKDEKLMELKNKTIPKSSSKSLNEQRKMANIFGSLSAVLFLVCFIMGAGLIQSDDRISELESKLSKLDQSYKYILTQFKDDNVESVFAELTEDTEAYTENNTETPVEITTDKSLTQTDNTADNYNTDNENEIINETILDNLDTPASEQTLNNEESYQTYVVQDGDSLESISRKFYGTIEKITEIMEVNNIEDPHKIYSGKTLILP